MPGGGENIKMKKISVSLSGHRTSVSLEAEFMSALHAIASKQNRPVAAIIGEIDAARGARTLSSALRVWILQNKI